MTNLRAAVDPPRRRITRQGTVLGSLPIINTTDDRWIAGFYFEPEACMDDGEIALSFDTSPCSVSAISYADPTATVDGTVLLVRAGTKCSTLSGMTRDERARAERLLASIESMAVGTAIWDLLVDSSNASFSNLSPGALDITPAPLALSALQGALLDCCGDEQGIIHADIRTVTRWQEFNLVAVQSGIIVDLYGNVIVADRGYDGSGPSAEAASAGIGWAYATNMIELRRSAVEVLEATDAGSGSAGSAQNDAYAIAQRYYGIAWDKLCHAAVRVDLCETACQQSGS